MFNHPEKLIVIISAIFGGAKYHLQHKIAKESKALDIDYVLHIARREEGGVNESSFQRRNLLIYHFHKHSWNNSTCRGRRN